METEYVYTPKLIITKEIISNFVLFYLVFCLLKVKVVVQFKGREMQHTQNGRELLLKLFQPLQDIATMDGDPKLEGRSMLMMLSPKKIST